MRTDRPGKLRPECQRCTIERNRDADRQSKNRDPEAFLKRGREATARYREQHPDRIAEYKEQNRERMREYSRAYYAEFPERVNERGCRWAREHPEEHRAIGRNRRARMRAAQGTHTAADVAAQRTRQKGRCYWCGEKVGRHYHVDHVVPLARGGSNGPENLVVTCPTCNRSKGAKLPHEFSDRLC